MWNCREKENESEINYSNEYKIQQEFWLCLEDQPEVWKTFHIYQSFKDIYHLKIKLPYLYVKKIIL